MTVAQRSMVTHHILSSRLNENADDGLDISLNLLEPAATLPKSENGALHRQCAKRKHRTCNSVR